MSDGLEHDKLPSKTKADAASSAKIVPSTRAKPAKWPADAPERRTVAIPSAPGYLATEGGEIINAATGRVLKPWLAGYGYRYVMLGAKGPKGAVHRFVALAFLGPPPTPKHEVAHNDGDLLNNRPDNLRWATRKENEADKVKHGTNRRPSWRGAEHPRTHLTDADVAYIRTAGISSTVLGRQFKVHPSTICRIVRGATWAA